MKVAIAVVVVSVIFAATIMNGTHNEDSLLSDWSQPPPWPIFIGINALAGMLRSIADALTPPPVRMINMSFKYMDSALAYVCYKYDIAEFLGSGPKTIDDIAKFTGTKDIIQMERVMYAMASVGLTKLVPSASKDEPNKFVNTALSATLRKSHPQYMGGMVGSNFEDWSIPVDKIANSIGPNPSPPWDIVHPEYKNPGGYFRFLKDHPESEEQFAISMMGVEGLGGGAMSIDAPFHKYERFIDIGGSMGHFLYKVMKRHPDKEAVLFDQPSVIDKARKHWYEPNGQFNDMNKQLKMVKGSFFVEADIPPIRDGDVLHLRYILHDWGPEEGIKILTNLRNAMKGKKATLLIGECAIPDRNAVGLPDMHYIDILMMNLFYDAVERTPEMWKEVLNKTGFDIVAIHPTRSITHFVEAVPRSE